MICCVSGVGVRSNHTNKCCKNNQAEQYIEYVFESSSLL
jgi:hypothetical protein